MHNKKKDEYQSLFRSLPDYVFINVWLYQYIYLVFFDGLYI